MCLVVRMVLHSVTILLKTSGLILILLVNITISRFLFPEMGIEMDQEFAPRSLFEVTFYCLHI